MVALLERLGVTVDFPLEQTCCGQMHFNTGYADQIVPLVRRFVRVFAESELVVSPSASCVGMVRDYYSRVAELSGDRDLRAEVGDKPVRLLRAVRGLDLVDLPEAQECCGFGGTFAVKNADTSIAMLTDKVRTILDTGTEVCASADSSCLMQIGGALSRQHAGVRTMHLAEIVAATDDHVHSG